MTGASVGKLYTQVVDHWDEIKFVSANGKKLNYQAVIETEQGNITLELWPEIAPNHVRNFVALARAHFFDGLVFERTIQDEVTGTEFKRQIIEGGCPDGSGDVVACGTGTAFIEPELL